MQQIKRTPAELEQIVGEVQKLIDTENLDTKTACARVGILPANFYSKRCELRRKSLTTKDVTPVKLKPVKRQSEPTVQSIPFRRADDKIQIKGSPASVAAFLRSLSQGAA